MIRPFYDPPPGRERHDRPPAIGVSSLVITIAITAPRSFDADPARESTEESDSA